ncbi:TetR/AcrR family transcriptional regulator [Metasolibacillus meyeri]|uniref:TetR/AcrR family transcriptional regulator n=1 Tax=Metasolibacillus meyeri TaxID=1071052 RepID=A0AAW9NJY7_9BACL|nr:TetR/AcrR family transcriptional regulator [Metasolibacillus meyeri]MEC1177412.1 TetR/AcrR family transcriptional regulator [Metasolibacillus meyeri]
MNGFERRKELKKSHILEAALALFLKYGIHKVAVAEIAKEANVSQVTIYNYFDSKDNLVKEVIVFYVHQIWEEYKQLFDSDMPFPDKVKKMIFDKKDYAKQTHEEFFNDFMAEYASENNYIEKFYTETVLPSILKLFEEGKKQGYVDASISNEAILFYIQMFAEYMQKDGASQNMLSMTEDLTKLFFFGIAGKVKESLY